MVYFWFGILTSIGALLLVVSRPLHYTEKAARGRYIVYNHIFETVCFDGKTFVFKRTAVRKAESLEKIGLFFNDMFEVRKIV